jgi:hypothetical protein
MPIESNDKQVDAKARWTPPRLTRFAAAEAENAIDPGPDLSLLGS